MYSVGILTRKLNFLEEDRKGQFLPSLVFQDFLEKWFFVYNLSYINVIKGRVRCIVFSIIYFDIM